MAARTSFGEMGVFAIHPDTSEPPVRPVERATPASASADYVMGAFEEHRLQLSSFAYGLARDRDVAEDLVQESFLRLVRELNAGRTPDNVKAWLFRVCSNLAVSRGRRISVAQRFLRVARTHDEPAADVEILRREASASLSAALATLPTEARAALLMAAQGFSGREIAEAIGRSETATRTMMFRAREKVRICMVREGTAP